MQRRIIFFQDEGSLTKRLCEKGNFKAGFLMHIPMKTFLHLQNLFFPPLGMLSKQTFFSFHLFSMFLYKMCIVNGCVYACRVNLCLFNVSIECA